MKKPWTWKNVEIAPNLSEKLQQEFEVSFFQGALEQDPENVEVLVTLGDVYSRLGKTRAGLDIDKRLVRICPDEPTFHYNLACSYSLLGDLDPALKALEKAIQLGYQNFEHLKKDSDLDNLRQDGRFHVLLKTHAPQT